MKKDLVLATGDTRKALRNAYTKKLRLAKRNHERKLAESRSVWDVLKRKDRSDATWELEVGGHTIKDCSSIASAFKDAFIEKVVTLRKTASPSELEIVVPQVKDIWDFHACTDQDILSIIQNLKTSNSSGPDKISSKLLKEVRQEITPALVTLVNRCLLEGHFPECFKEGKVIPVPKKGSRKNVKNYRPITMTSVIGKIVECAANIQLTQATDKHLPSTLFGFRKNMGTSDALVKLTDEIKRNRASGKFVAALTCDASSAFDLLDRQLVIKMLIRLGSGQTAIKFFESFLAGASQYVSINECTSDTWSLDVGSGQGHVLSAPLYNIGTLSQYYWTSLSVLFGYADDGTDLITASTIAECNEKIKLVMNERKRWYDLAGMALNIEKTSLIGFGFCPDPITINNTIITPVTSFKFLGLTIEQSLGQDLQVKSISGKIRAAAAKIRADGTNFKIADRRRLYMGWVQGVLCSNSAAYLPLLNVTQIYELQTACNSAIRSVVKMPRKSSDISITDIRKRLNIMSVQDLADKAIYMQAWKDRAVINTNTNKGGPLTRSQARGDILQPDQRGILGKMVLTLAKCAYNKLPNECRNEEDAGRAKRQIQKFVKDSSS